MATINNNYCSSAIGDTGALANFCTYYNTSSFNCNKAATLCRSDQCKQISNQGEWVYNPNIHQEIGCGTNDCPSASIACSDVLIGIETTANVVCARQSFTGDPLLCCLQDYDCRAPNSTDQLCFQYDTNRNATCDPAYRNASGPDCYHNIFSFCLGLDLSNPRDDSWIYRWINPNGTIKGLNWQPGDDPTDRGCYYFLRRILSNKCLVPGEFVITNFSNSGYIWATELMENLLIRYQEAGYDIGAYPGQTGYNIFSEFLYRDIATLYPGIFSTALTNYCKNTTTKQLTLNPILANWCGCYLPASEYITYVNQYLTPVECTPPCNRLNTIPLVDGTGQTQLCSNNVCLIDSTTVDLINSTVGGNIDIRQICGNCGGQCSCIINNTDILTENATIGGNITVGEVCTTSLCTRPNPDGDTPANIIVPCSESLDDNPIETLTETITKNAQENFRIYLLWLGLALILLLIFVYILVWVRSGF